MSSTFQASCIDVLTIIPFDQWRDNTMMIIATLDSCGMFIQRDHITLYNTVSFAGNVFPTILACRSNR